MTKPDTAAELFAEYRQAAAPSADAMTRMEAGLAGQVAANATYPEGGGLSLLTKVGIAAVVVGAAAALFLWPATSEAPSQPVAVPPQEAVETPAAAPALPPPTEAAGGAVSAREPERDGETQPEVRPERKAPHKQPAASDSAAGTPPVDQLKAEMALLGRAQAAIADGDAEDALRLLRRHARKFPEGYMEPERLLQEMVALCELGRTDEARSKAQRFLKQRPNSPLSAHVSSVCTDR